MTRVTEILNLDYTAYVELIGTAHFTRRSIRDASAAIAALRPRDVALELDWRRFRALNAACLACPRRAACEGLCEFTAATESLGNVDANIWLIDMTEQEMRRRIRSHMTPGERRPRGAPGYGEVAADPRRLWEWGRKDEVIRHSQRAIAQQRRRFPSVWRVLLDERNALMAVRLAWIASKNLRDEAPSTILAVVGAAHVPGIRSLLQHPLRLRETLRRLQLPFAEPTLIRRVAVHAA